MAKNVVNGETVVIIAPTGGTLSGVPLVVNDLVVVALQTAPKGAQVTCSTGGGWMLPAAAGLKQGQKVSILAAGSLVAAGTADSVPFGKLLGDAVGGYANALLIQQ